MTSALAYTAITICRQVKEPKLAEIKAMQCQALAGPLLPLE
jgi:hypothetical protein